MRVWLEGNTLVTRTSREEVRLQLAEVTSLRFVSSSRDTGSVLLHSARQEVELAGVGWNTRSLRFEFGRRLQRLGTVRQAHEDRWAWERLGVRAPAGRHSR